jgi:hypothetical protein
MVPTKKAVNGLTIDLSDLKDFVKLSGGKTR